MPLWNKVAEQAFSSVTLEISKQARAGVVRGASLLQPLSRCFESCYNGTCLRVGDQRTTIIVKRAETVVKGSGLKTPLRDGKINAFRHERTRKYLAFDMGIQRDLATVSESCVAGKSGCTSRSSLCFA